MNVLGEMEAQLLIEVQLVLQNAARHSLEDRRKLGRSVNRPLGCARGLLHRATPLDEATLLADVDLLASADQADDDAPLPEPVLRTR